MRLNPMLVLLIGLLPVACGNNDDDDSSVEGAQADCAALASLDIAPESIGLPSGGAMIDQAVFLQSPVAYCQLNGAVSPIDSSAPDINFQINLPVVWNAKGLHYGGGGYNGTLVTGLDQVKFNPDDAPTPLERGYATWGSDSGHQTTGFDASFMLNEESIRNFGGEQLKKTLDVALAAVTEFYGSGAESVYFQGSSQGGHEAMIATQRWPDDYDGAIIVHPANSFVGLQLSGNRAGQALYQENAYLDPSDVELLNNSVLAVCDEIDGAADLLVSDTAGCRGAFDIQSLRCESGLPEHGVCFGDAQIAALDVIDTRTQTPLLQGGAQGFSGWPIYLAADLYGLWGMGTSAEPTIPPTPVENFGLAVLADPLIRFGILQDPEANSLEFSQSGNEERIVEVSTITDAMSTDLSAFTSRGGKILLLHGTTDFAIPFGNTVDWYQRIVAQGGQADTDEFMRFWLVPGFGHGSGAFQMRWDSLRALEAWVEEGVAPESLTITDAAEATAGRTRPLCEFPTFARLNDGATDLDSAESFTCVE